MIEIVAVKNIEDATQEELADLRRKGFLLKAESKRSSERSLSPYEILLLRITERRGKIEII